MSSAEEKRLLSNFISKLSDFKKGINPPYSDSEAAKLMKKIAKNTDTEGAHGEADDLLCEVLSNLGYEKLVAAYQSFGKWYA